MNGACECRIQRISGVRAARHNPKYDETRIGLNPDVVQIRGNSVNSVYLNKETGDWAISRHFDGQLREYLATHEVSRAYAGVSTILLNVTRRCNLACRYCVIGDKKNSQDMPVQVAVRAMERVAEVDPIDRHVLFHGSEPMANFALISAVLELTKRRDYTIQYSLQTNGTLLTRDSVSQLVEAGVRIGVSLDGLPEHHNRARPYVDGRPSYDSVIRGVDLVREIQGYVTVITVVTSDNVNTLPEMCEHFESEGISAVSFCPVSHSERKIAPSAATMAQQLRRIFDRYLSELRAGRQPIRIENFRTYLQSTIPRHSPSNCVRCTLGGRYPVLGIDIDGAIYPCDFFWGDRRYQIGNIFDHGLGEVINRPDDFRMARDVNAIPACSHCQWKRPCGGGCPGTPFMERGTVNACSSYCGLDNDMFQYVMEQIPLLYENGLIPTILGK